MSSWNSLLLFGMMYLLSVVDSLTAHTMRNHCNNNDILVDCNVVNYNRRNYVSVSSNFTLLNILLCFD